MRYNEFAQRDGWIVAYPNAIEGHWNDLRGFDGFVSHRENVDDVGFIERLVDHLATEFAIDEDRVYLTGGSNGGMMAHAAANQLADRFAAIAPIVGAMPRPVYDGFSPGRAISVLMINDRGDPAVLWDGGAGGRANFVSVPATVDKWREVNHCRDEAVTPAEALADEPDDVRVTHTVWNRCAPGVSMELYAVEADRHGHPTAFLDKEGRRRVYEVIWDFFAANGR